MIIELREYCVQLDLISIKFTISGKIDIISVDLRNNIKPK